MLVEKNLRDEYMSEARGSERLYFYAIMKKRAHMEPFIALFVFLVLLVFWGWMLRDMVTNDWLPPNQKYYWAAAFLFTFIVGAGLYYFIEYRPRHN